MRALALGLLAGATLGLTALPASAESVTTRIEPRPFYGATVTIEEGVRVFRPLPPHDRVIINPGHKTPLNLSFEERRIYSYNQTHNYNYDANGAYPGGAYGSYLSGGRHAGRHRAHRAAR